MNSRVEESQLRLFDSVNLGVAVALHHGLVVPVIRGADSLTLSQVSAAIHDLAERARNNKLIPDDYRGGTFTVSNLGMCRIREFVAIINPPQAGSRALGEAAPRAIVRHGTLCAAPIMTATLSADHRAVDGVAAARFLVVIRESLETPEQLLGAGE